MINNKNIILNGKKVLIISSILLIILIVFFIIRNSLAQSLPIRSIVITSENTSFENNEPGAWQITKSAEFLSTGKVRITFDVETVLKKKNLNTDVVLILDTSYSMKGERLTKLQEASTHLVESVLTNDQNKMAIIAFNSKSIILSDFSNNEDDLIEKINSLEATEKTNYYAAFVDLETLLENYTKEEEKDLIVLLVVDGYPNQYTPNEVAQYNYIKDKYPYMIVNAVQYQMFRTIAQPIKDVSDSQYVAKMETIKDVLLEASVNPIEYSNFEITDYIDEKYFSIDNIDKIDVNRGSVNLDYEGDTPKITWSMNNGNIKAGQSAKMTIEVNLKDDYINNKGLYTTNNGEHIISSIVDNMDENITSTKTPILKNNYDVIYDVNAPDDCTLDNISNENYFVFDTVEKKSYKPSCKGYLFKGWEILEQDVTKINDDVFVMPEHDVTLRGVWSKQSISKSMDGTVHEKTTLYKVVQNGATKTDEDKYAEEYTGNGSDTFANKVYYYTTNMNNNVLFAGFCWKMVRTTDTGGVKIIYNGEPDENDQCLSSRGNHMGYSGTSSISLNSNYYYGNSYTYDSTSKKFTLNPDGTTLAKWSDETSDSLIGKYTCRSNSVNATCSTLYYVESYKNNTTANVFSLNSNAPYSSIGSMPFNKADNSLAYAGYMYNKIYPFQSKTNSHTQNVISSLSFSLNYYYSDAVDDSNNRYSLLNPQKITSSDQYDSLVGKYTFFNTNESNTSSTVYYIVAHSGSTMYYLEIPYGNTIEDSNLEITFGDNIIDNGDGTFTLTNPVTVKKSEWPNKYKDYKNKYTCNSSSITCSNLYFTYATTARQFTYIDVYVYGNKYDYVLNETTGKYEYVIDLNDANTHRKYEMSNKSSLINSHYTCFNNTGRCETISYIFGAQTTSLKYIDITDGKSINDALSEMLWSDNVNEYDSVAKMAIELWYENYMTDFTKYLEDTIFCNNRTIDNLNGWNYDGGDVSSSLYFSDAYASRINLICNENDAFSTTNEKAKLKYPVGIITNDEYNLSKGVYVGTTYWTMSPYTIIGADLRISIIPTGNASADNNYYGLRPVVSLKPEIEYSDGDGSEEYPYKIDLLSND